jgi:large subunit ribosomal protein L18
MLDISLRHVTAYVNHNSGTKVVEASTKEFCIARHLHKTSDVAAAFNVGRVIALRCKETGLNRIMWEHKKDRKHRKVNFNNWHRIIVKSLILINYIV